MFESDTFTLEWYGPLYSFSTEWKGAKWLKQALGNIHLHYKNRHFTGTPTTLRPTYSSAWKWVMEVPHIRGSPSWTFSYKTYRKHMWHDQDNTVNLRSKYLNKTITYSGNPTDETFEGIHMFCCSGISASMKTFLSLRHLNYCMNNECACETSTCAGKSKKHTDKQHWLRLRKLQIAGGIQIFQPFSKCVWKKVGSWAGIHFGNGFSFGSSVTLNTVSVRGSFFVQMNLCWSVLWPVMDEDEAFKKWQKRSQNPSLLLTPLPFSKNTSAQKRQRKLVQQGQTPGVILMRHHHLCCLCSALFPTIWTGRSFMQPSAVIVQ